MRVEGSANFIHDAAPYTEALLVATITPDTPEEHERLTALTTVESTVVHDGAGFRIYAKLRIPAVVESQKKLRNPKKLSVPTEQDLEPDPAKE